MGADVQVARLGDCLTTIIDHRGKTPKKLGSDWVQSGVPTISAMNVRGGMLTDTEAIRFVSDDVYRRWMNTGDLQRGDCLLASEGATLGECMYWDEDYPVALGQRLFCLRPNPLILYPRYLYAYMTSAAFQTEVIARATGTSVPGLRQTEVLELHVRLPPMSEQRAIGDVLYSINKKIALNSRMNQTLESMARALFRSWFVDFDPVRANMEGRPTGLPDKVAALFPDRLVNFPSGDVPEGWRIATLNEAFEVLSGGTPSRSEPAYWNGDIPWFSVRDAPTPSDVFVLRTEEHITREGIDNSAAQVLPVGTTIITARGTVGKLAMVGVPMATNQSCFGVRGRAGLSDIWTYFALHHAVTALQQNTHGSVFDTINRSTFDSVSAVLPPANLATAYEGVAKPLFNRIKANREQSYTLAATRDALMPKLLSGDLRIPSGAPA